MSLRSVRHSAASVAARCEAVCVGASIERHSPIKDAICVWMGMAYCCAPIVLGCPIDASTDSTRSAAAKCKELQVASRCVIIQSSGGTGTLIRHCDLQLCAPLPAYGTPVELAQFVRARHPHGIAVLLGQGLGGKGFIDFDHIERGHTECRLW